MNRKILLQVTAPALVIGTLLFGACLAGVWYISRLQADLATVQAQDLISLQAAQELEIRVRQLRFHSFLYLVDPRPDRVAAIETDHHNFEEALRAARNTVTNAEERGYLDQIETGYGQYRQELARLREQAKGPATGTEVGRLADAHPTKFVVEPCQELLRVSREGMTQNFGENQRFGSRLRLALLLLGFVGPCSGLLLGYGIARGLSRSIYQLSVRIQDVAQRLDQDVASMDVVADGDIQGLDRQLDHVVDRVEEVGRRLQKQQRDMLRAEQLAAVGQLAASVAHEVRNPLTSVKMLVLTALRGRNRKPLTDEDLEVIHGEIGRLEATVQEFLDFARPPTPRRRPTDLRDLLSQAVELVRPRARQQGVAVNIAAPESPVVRDVDPSLLHRVLVNLFLNSLEAMPTGGRLDVALEEVVGGGVRLTVADAGPGLPEAMNGRLFTPFASTKPTGTGLGLSICRRIVEEHGGTITGGDNPGGGARFTITLPETSAKDLSGCPGNSVLGTQYSVPGADSAVST